MLAEPHLEARQRNGGLCLSARTEYDEILVTCATGAQGRNPHNPMARARA